MSGEQQQRESHENVDAIYFDCPLLAAGLIALSGCGKSSTPTKISYREIGICKSYQTPSSTQQAKADEALLSSKSIRSTIQQMALHFTFIRALLCEPIHPEDKGIYIGRIAVLRMWIRKLGPLRREIRPDSTIPKAKNSMM